MKTSWVITATDLADLYRALGEHERARNVQIGHAMARGRRYAGRLPLRLNGRAQPRRRPRTGRTWREQQRDGSGRWIEGWT